MRGHGIKILSFIILAAKLEQEFSEPFNIHSECFAVQKVKKAYKLCFKCCCFRCFSFRNCRSCTAKTIQLANELPEFREFHFNFLRARCKSNRITSRMPSSALHRVAIKMHHILSVTRICLRIEVCYIIHFILTAFTGKAGFPPLSRSSPEETAGRVSVTVNSKFNLCVVTKHRKWEIRVGNVIFFFFASSSLWYLA